MLDAPPRPPERPAIQAWTEIFFTSREGLRLYGRRYAAACSTRRPVLCLAGLTRNSRDFHDLAVALSSGSPIARDVYTLDQRGRGQSDPAADKRSYTIQSELADTLDFMTLAGLHRAAIVGTSRGGLIAMALAAARPGALGALVLNDIGPVIERDGLGRIAAAVGRAPHPTSWADAARITRELNSRQFPGLGDGMWEEIARQWFNERDGRPVPGYDAKLAQSLQLPDGPLPALWPQFAALAATPLLVLRGEHSDVLSAATLEEMSRRHPRCDAMTVPGQGHAPYLKDTPTIAAIAKFLARTDSDRPHT